MFSNLLQHIIWSCNSQITYHPAADIKGSIPPLTDLFKIQQSDCLQAQHMSQSNIQILLFLNRDGGLWNHPLECLQ